MVDSPIAGSSSGSPGTTPLADAGVNLAGTGPTGLLGIIAPRA